MKDMFLVVTIRLVFLVSMPMALEIPPLIKRVLDSVWVPADSLFSLMVRSSLGGALLPITVSHPLVLSASMLMALEIPLLLLEHDLASCLQIGMLLVVPRCLI